MITFQDLSGMGTDDYDVLLKIITEYKASNMYQNAKIGDDYARQLNTTITNYQKLLYTMSGKAVPDNFSANHKCASNFFNRFVTQQASFLLGNGANFENENTKEMLGDDFDKQLYFAGKNALIHGVSYGFFNFDHVEIFTALEFAPVYDEENGSLRAGVRFWQLDDRKPLRFTFYSEDGYQHFIVKDGAPQPFSEKRPYKITKVETNADGEQIVNGENYPSFPIVPLWGNPFHQSEIVGIRAEIDCYDLIKSGFANDLDDASQIYWTLENAGGMDDMDLAKFIQRMKTVHAATVGEEGDGVKATSHTIDVPYQSRETYLDRLEKDLYKDYMALDVENMASGAMTATQILAAYEKVNEKTDEFEFNVLDFVKELLELNGMDDKVTFTRSMIVNQQEMVTTILAASANLPEEYIVKKLLDVFGDTDKAKEILGQLDAENMDDMDMFGDEEEESDSVADFEDFTNEIVSMLEELTKE